MDFDDLGPTLGTPLRIPDTAHRGPDCRESAEGVASVYEWRDKGSLGLRVEGFRVSGLRYASLLDNGASGAGVVGFFRGLGCLRTEGCNQAQSSDEVEKLLEIWILLGVRVEGIESWRRACRL